MDNENSSNLSKLQIAYYSHLLTLKKPKWEESSAHQAIIRAKVDPIPHQVEAALFAFRNPLSGGVILADEVGLGKTIESGIVLSQLWSEGKRKILIIAPKSLRHQWQDELENLFYLKAQIVDTQSYSRVLKSSSDNPLDEKEKIFITNEHFIVKFENKIRSIDWDIVIIDEAHKLRNVYKSGKNDAKRAKVIRETLQGFKKLLLTATPMQNNLMELYGLASFIDPYLLGTADSFKKNFVTVNDELKEEKLEELKYRMAKFFKRELRKNVKTFISYTDRHAITIPFDPTDDEEELRIKFEQYLKDPNTIALPSMATGFLRLIYFKLLASSSFAIKNSLNNLYIKLIYISVTLDNQQLYDQLMNDFVIRFSAPDGQKSQDVLHLEKILFKNISPANFEGLKENLTKDRKIEEPVLVEENEIIDNYSDEDIENIEVVSLPNSSTPGKILIEAQLILDLISLSREMRKNTKGAALISALKEQFSRAHEKGWPEKAVIFTEFKTTQAYVLRVLEEFGLDINKDVVIFNGDSGDAEQRRALVEEFRHEKKIFLTTEAGAEGLNLQFCNLVINYDLPWNPQRIEQRIGRCHRYGQKLDVVVINFLNKKNYADARVLELLNKKFQLFEGTFGASNSVLGAIESGHDIEKDIFNIYLSCRDEEEIKNKFDELLLENQEQVTNWMNKARDIILNDFDEEVQNKLKDFDKRMRDSIDEIQGLVASIVISYYQKSFKKIDEQFFKFEDKDERVFTFDKRQENNAVLIHPFHSIVEKVRDNSFFQGDVVFGYTGNHNISLIKDLVGLEGQFKIYQTRFDGIESKEMISPIFISNENKVLSIEQGEKLLSVTCNTLKTSDEKLSNDLFFTTTLEAFIENEKEMLQEYNQSIYHEEVENIELYFDDLQNAKKIEIEVVENEIAKLKKERRKLPLALQRESNLVILKLKQKIIKMEEEVTQLKIESSKKEKDKLESLNKNSELKINSKIIAEGKFKIS